MELTVIIVVTVTWIVAYYIGWFHGYKDGRLIERERALDE